MRQPRFCNFFASTLALYDMRKVTVTVSNILLPKSKAVRLRFPSLVWGGPFSSFFQPKWTMALKKRLYCHQKRQTFYPVRLCLWCPASQDKVKWDKVSQSHQRQALKQGTFKYLTCSNRLIVCSSLLQLWTSSPAIDPVRSLPHTPWRCRHVPCVAAVANQMNQMNWCRYWIEDMECLKCDKTYFATKSLVGFFWSLRTLAHAQMQTCPRIFNPNIFLWVSFEGSKLLNLLKTSGADANCLYNPNPNAQAETSGALLSAVASVSQLDSVRFRGLGRIGYISTYWYIYIYTIIYIHWYLEICGKFMQIQGVTCDLIVVLCYMNSSGQYCR